MPVKDAPLSTTHGIDPNHFYGDTTTRRDPFVLLLAERLGHLFMGGIGFGVAWWCQQHGITPHARFNELFAAAVNVASIGAGFLGTMVALLLSLDERPVVQMAKRTVVYRRLVRYMLSAIVWCFLAAVASAIGSLHDFKEPLVDTVSQVLFCAWIGITVTAVVSTGRVILILWELLLIVSRREE